MHNLIPIEEDLFYVGGSDRKLSLFENVYPVPRGMAYNSYLLIDEKTVLFNTVDSSVFDEFFESVKFALKGRTLDYLVVQHMEPDHSASLLRLLEQYPLATVVMSQKAEMMIKNFFSFEPKNILLVKEGDLLKTGKRRIRFLAAPMVHWPEVMLCFEESERVLFSADAFGTFGALNHLFAEQRPFEELLPEARRYYFNIVGKYGIQVQNVLKKAAALEIKTVCPLHGPVWRENFKAFFEKYDLWSKYLPEKRGVVLFYGTIYGHTKQAAEFLSSELVAKGVDCELFDVSKTELSELLSEAFLYPHAVFLSATYNNGIFLKMEQLLTDLSEHFYQKRSYSLVECGSWSPQAGELMEKRLSEMKGMKKVGETITILSSMKEQDEEALKALAKEIIKDIHEIS